MHSDKWKNRFFFIRRVNIIKTLRLNFHLLTFHQAIRFPILVYGKLKITNLTGKIVFTDSKIRTNMLRFGSAHEMSIKSAGIAQLSLSGTLKVEGYALIGIDSCVYIEKNSILELGDQCYIGRNSNIFCTEYIRIGAKNLIGSEAYVTDSSFHQIVEKDHPPLPLSKPVVIGKQNYWGTRVIIQKGTATPDYCIICSGSVCNKDYRQSGENIMIGGVPAKLIKNDVRVVFDL